MGAFCTMWHVVANRGGYGGLHCGMGFHNYPLGKGERMWSMVAHLAGWGAYCTGWDVVANEPGCGELQCGFSLQ